MTLAIATCASRLRIQRPKGSGIASTNALVMQTQYFCWTVTSFGFLPATHLQRELRSITSTSIHSTNKSPSHFSLPMDDGNSFTALTQLVDYIATDPVLTKVLNDGKYAVRAQEQAQVHQRRLADIESQARIAEEDPLSAHNIGKLLKDILPRSTTFVIEAGTAAHAIHDHLQPSRPGSWTHRGATGIGWSNGAALGVKMALKDMEEIGEAGPSLVCYVVGDGNFMCGAPSSALWVASKYKIPVLTLVLNNGGAYSQHHTLAYR